MPGDTLSAKQEEKLKLEIEELRRKNRWATPIVATLLAVAGFFFTIVQFQCQRSDEQAKDRSSREEQQRKDRAGKEVEQMARFQNQLHSDIDEILHSARDEGQTAARVLFLLEDMKTVINSRINETEKFSDRFDHYERDLSKSLTILVRDDYDFSKNPRDVSRANVVSEHWADYSDYLRKEPDKLDYILYKYTEALQNFRDQHLGYLECLDLDKETDQVKVCRQYERQKNDQLLYDYFSDIVNGFTRHIKLVGDNQLSDADRKRKDKILLDFQEALCNRKISEHFIGTYLPGGKCRPGH